MRDPRFAKANAWEQHNRATDEQIAQARIDARAVAERQPDCDALRSAMDVLSKERRPGCWQAFSEEFVFVARETCGRQNTWALAIGTAFSEARNSAMAKATVREDGPAIRHLAEEWSREWSPFSVWHRYSSHFSSWREDLWFWGSLFVQVHPAEGLRALDAGPHPWPVEEILSLCCREDRTVIEEMIVAAPLVFDAKGDWVSARSFVALLVTEMITKHAMALSEAVTIASRVGQVDAQRVCESSIDELQNCELPAWMRAAFRILLQRPDGLNIALGYLGKLSRDVMLLGQNRDKSGKSPWNATTASFSALLAVFGEAGLTTARVRAAWVAAERLAEHNAPAPRRRKAPALSSNKKTEREGEGSQKLRAEGLPLFVGAALMLCTAPVVEAEIESLWGWFEELLVGRDPALSLINHGSSLQDIPQRLGFLLSRLPDPDARLRAAYLRLEPQRRRAQFACSCEDHDIDLGSVIILRVGLSAAVNWHDRVRGQEQAAAAREFFFWIFTAARRLWLTAVLDVQYGKRRLVSACFAFMPVLFGNQLGEALKRTLPPIAGDARLLAEACSMLSMNGCDPVSLPTLVAEAGADLVAALRDIRQWSELTGRREDCPEHLRVLGEMLQLAVSRDNSVPTV